MSFKINVFAEEPWPQKCECKQGSQRMCRNASTLRVFDLWQETGEEKEMKEDSIRLRPKQAWSMFPWNRGFSYLLLWYLSRALHPSISTNIEMEAWRSLVWYSEVEFSCWLSRSYQSRDNSKEEGCDEGADRSERRVSSSQQLFSKMHIGWIIELLDTRKAFNVIQVYYIYTCSYSEAS